MSGSVPIPDSAPPPAGGSKLRAWAELLRLPNLLTVPGDPLAGFLLARLAVGVGEPVEAVRPVTAALLLYCAGLISNDYWDLAKDRRERPARPLPSGRVRPRTAIVAAAALGLTGVAVAVSVGPGSGLIGVLLACFIVAYNAGGKRVPAVGPILMGLCRGLSLMLGAAALGGPGVATLAVVLSVAGLTLYVEAVTTIAARETQAVTIGARRWEPMIVVAVWMFALLPTAGPTEPLALGVFAALAVAAVLHAADCAHALRRVPAPPTVQKTIGRLVRGLLVIQATLASLAPAPGWVAAAALLAMLPAAWWLGRRFHAS